jgi:hypothetical protein
MIPILAVSEFEVPAAEVAERKVLSALEIALMQQCHHEGDSTPQMNNRKAAR